jgi:hypothetical protein
MAGEKISLSEYVQRTRVLGVCPYTNLEMGVTVGFMNGEPTAAFYLGEGADPTCMISLEQLGMILALFNELESTA